MLLQPVEPPYLHPDYEGPPRGHKHDGHWTDWEFQYADAPDANDVRWKLFRRYCRECGMLEYRNDREHLITAYYSGPEIAGTLETCAGTIGDKHWWIDLTGSVRRTWTLPWSAHPDRRIEMTSPLLIPSATEPQPYEIIVRFLW